MYNNSDIQSPVSVPQPPAADQQTKIEACGLDVQEDPRIGAGSVMARCVFGPEPLSEVKPGAERTLHGHHDASPGGEGAEGSEFNTIDYKYQNHHVCRFPISSPTWKF